MGIGLGIAAGVAGAASAGTSVLGGIEQGEAAEASAEAEANQAAQQANIARENAQLEAQNAQNAISASQLKAQQDQQAGALELAKQRAEFGASGIDADYGSDEATQQSTALNTGRSVGADQYQGTTESIGDINKQRQDNLEGDNDDANAYNDRQAGKAAKKGAVLGGIINGVGQGLQTASSVAGLGDFAETTKKPSGGTSESGSNPFSGSGTTPTPKDADFELGTTPNGALLGGSKNSPDMFGQ